MAAPRKTKTSPAATPVVTPVSTPAVTIAPAVPAVPATPAIAAPIAKSEVKGSGTVAKPAPRTITHEMIAKRAYEIYAGRGYRPGSPDEDWREAERLLRAGL